MKVPKYKGLHLIHGWKIDSSQDEFDDAWSMATLTYASTGELLFFDCFKGTVENLVVSFDEVLGVPDSPIEVKFRFDKNPTQLLQGVVGGNYQSVVFDGNEITKLRENILDSNDLLVGVSSHTLKFTFEHAKLALAAHGEYCNWKEFKVE